MMIKVLVAVCLLLQLTEAQQQQCSSDNDCGASQCCSSSLFGGHIGGKRRRFLLDSILGHGRGGTCMGLAQEGDSCEPDMMIFGGSQAHTFGCPCAEGLECHGERESHSDGSHSYTNPKCIPEGTYTGGSGTGTGTGTATGTGTGTGTQTGAPVLNTQRPPASTALPVVDPNQPVHELPGK